MKNRILILILAVLAMPQIANAQKKASSFALLYDACKLARSASSNGEGSPAEMKRARQLFNSARWGALIFTNESEKARKKELRSLRGHLVFMPEFFDSLVVNRKVYKFAEERENRGGGGTKMIIDARITTRVLRAGEKRTFTVDMLGGKLRETLDIAVVSEPRGLAGLVVTLTDQEGKSRQFKSNSAEYAGAADRHLSMPLAKGRNKVSIELTNKANIESSFAIIMSY